MFFDDNDSLDDFIGDYSEALRKAEDYNGQPRGDDGRFGKGKQNRTQKPTSDLYLPIDQKTPDASPKNA